MNILKEFDEAIAKQESEKNSVGRGYKIGEKKPYDAYMDNESWLRFIKQMRPEHYNQYNSGSGKELESKDGKPPKMASFASSSQMICRLSRNVKGFVFEEQLPTTVGGLANLDGYLPLSEKLIFVEAKCREPYGHSGEQTISTKYEELYRYLANQENFPFKCEIKKEADEAKNMQVAFAWEDQKVEHFDIKQMICHLLGIATKLLKYPEDRKIQFLYLLYNPTDLSMPQIAKEEILHIYSDTCWAANHYDFKAMFGHIIDFLIAQKGFRADDIYVAQLKDSFDFMLCDQNNYQIQLK